jgi:hypothetical protein
MEVEKLGHMESFNDLELGRLFYRGRLGMRVSFASDRNVLWFDAEPKAVVFDGADLVNKSVFVLDNPVFQVTRDLALWRLGIPNGPASGIVIVSKDGQWLRAYHASGEFDIDLVSGEGHRIKADENVAWTRAWRIVVSTGTEDEATLLQSAEWTTQP